MSCRVALKIRCEEITTDATKSQNQYFSTDLLERPSIAPTFPRDLFPKNSQWSLNATTLQMSSNNTDEVHAHNMLHMGKGRKEQTPDPVPTRRIVYRKKVAMSNLD